MGNPDDAADALQDGLISAFRRADSFRGDAQVTTWLHRVIVNACLDRLRSQKVRAVDALPDDLEEYAGRGSLATAAGSDPADEAGAGDVRRAVLEALATLPPDQRAALILVDMEGYPVAEVAEMLDCAVGTIKSRCSRGRAKLAPLLGALRPSGTGDITHGNQPSAPTVPSTDPARAPPPRLQPVRQPNDPPDEEVTAK
jgi:RNA polymerase sigma-70 factor (ECF subfamily)